MKYELPYFKKHTGGYKISPKKILFAEKIRFSFLEKIKKINLSKNEEKEILLILKKDMPHFWIHRRGIKLSTGRLFIRVYNNVTKKIKFKMDYVIPTEELLNITSDEVSEWKKLKYKIRKMMGGINE